MGYKQVLKVMLQLKHIRTRKEPRSYGFWIGCITIVFCLLAGLIACGYIFCCCLCAKTISTSNEVLAKVQSRTQEKQQQLKDRLKFETEMETIRKQCREQAKYARKIPTPQANYRSRTVDDPM